MVGTLGNRHGPLDRRRRTAATVALAVAILAFFALARTAYATEVSGPALVVSLDTSSMAASPSWTPLGNIVLNELAPDDIAAGQTGASLILRAPAGWEFRSGAGQVLASVFPGDITSDGLTVTASEISIALTTDDLADAFDVIVLADLEVRPTTSTPTTGTIYRPAGAGGTAVLSGIVASPNANGAGGTSFGSLTSVVGSATSNLQVETLDANTSAGSPTTSLIAGRPFAARISAVDQFGNRAAAAGEAIVTFTTNAGSAADGSPPSVPAAATPTFASGVAFVTDLMLARAASGNTITAAVNETGTTAIPLGAAGTSLPTTVSPGPVRDFVIEANGGGPIGSVPALTPFAIQITARDLYQNPAASGPNSFSGAGMSVVLSANVAGVTGLGTTPSFVDGMLVNHTVTLSEPSAEAILTATRSGGPDSTTGSSSLFVVEAGTPPILSVPPALTVIAETPAGTASPDQLGLITAFLAGATASDAVDGSPLPVTNDAPPFFPIGTVGVQFSAVDTRGVSSVVTVDVDVMSVSDAFALLDQRVAALGLESGLESRLHYWLGKALRKYEHGDLYRTMQYLGAFIWSVQSESGQGIAEADASALESDARRISDVLSLRRSNEKSSWRFR